MEGSQQIAHERRGVSTVTPQATQDPRNLDPRELTPAPGTWVVWRQREDLRPQGTLSFLHQGVLRTRKGTSQLSVGQGGDPGVQGPTPPLLFPCLLPTLPYTPSSRALTSSLGLKQRVQLLPLHPVLLSHCSETPTPCGSQTPQAQPPLPKLPGVPPCFLSPGLSPH